MTQLQKSTNPDLHPFAREREYARALNATKLDKIFAKPLVKAMDDHIESVRVMRRSNQNAMTFYSGEGLIFKRFDE